MELRVFSYNPKLTKNLYFEVKLHHHMANNLKVNGGIIWKNSLISTIIYYRLLSMPTRQHAIILVKHQNIQFIFRWVTFHVGYKISLTPKCSSVIYRN